MTYKRILSLLLVLSLLLCLTACGTPKEQKPEATQAATIPFESTGETLRIENTEAPAATEPAVAETRPPKTPKTGVKVLSLQKQLYLNYEWNDATMLALSEYSTVNLWQDDAARYPAIAQVLETLSTMQKNSMEEEYDNILGFAKEMLDAAPDNFETNVSKLDIQVRRADSVAISLLSDSWSDFGFIEDFRGMQGTNFDTQTGRELTLSDVIKDMVPIPEIVAQELNSHMWAGDFSYDSVVMDYFRNTPEDGISWTLDYNGVTFYFGDGDLSEPGNGRQSATVSFVEHPELFEKKYMEVPEAYMVELPLDHSFFADLDGNGDLEELNVTGWYDTVMDMYAKYGICTDTAGCYHYEEYCADDFIPYYVKTAEGGHYLYLFGKFLEGPFPSMSLVMYDVSGGALNRIGEMNVGPGYIPTDIYRVPTDPKEFWLDDFDSGAQDMMAFAVGATGLPEQK